MDRDDLRHVRREVREAPEPQVEGEGDQAGAEQSEVGEDRSRVRSPGVERHGVVAG